MNDKYYEENDKGNMIEGWRLRSQTERQSNLKKHLEHSYNSKQREVKAILT